MGPGAAPVALVEQDCFLDSGEFAEQFAYGKVQSGLAGAARCAKVPS